MARRRLRRLVTRGIRWACVPIIAFVLVVAVAMGCAVWSPVQDDGEAYGPTWEMFEPEPSPGRQLPRALRQYGGSDMYGMRQGGFGFSIYIIAPEGFPEYFHIEHRKQFAVLVGRAGLPFRCLRWTFDLREGPVEPPLWVRGIETHQANGPPVNARRIPLMPEPIGMFLNILIVSTAIVLVRAGVRRAVVHRRRRENLCVNCAYPVGDFAVCPECGKPTESEA